MKIVVGSKNPVKVGAVEDAFRQYWPDCEVLGIEVSSGVSSQPMSELETINGARQRAYKVLEMESSADYGVGIEAGVTELSPTSSNWTGSRGGTKSSLFECAWVCVVAKSQILNSQILKSEKKEYLEGLGGGLYFELPEKIASRIRQGEELGPIMNELSESENVKQRMGAIGILSKNKLDRRRAYEQIVLSAMIRHVSPEWFN